MEPFIVNAKTDLYAILGDPISHSMSPVIHNNAFRRFGMDKVFPVSYTHLDVYKRQAKNEVRWHM